MGMPVNISEVFKIATDMKEVANTPISLMVMIDDTANGELVSHVRTAFAGMGAHTKVTIDYIGDDLSAIPDGLDMAVVVAGRSASVGLCAQSIRDAGVPAMIVTDNPEETFALAESTGHPLDSADIIYPEKLVSGVTLVREQIAQSLKKHGDLGESLSKLLWPSKKAPNEGSAESGQEGLEARAIPINDETMEALDGRMGEWIISTCGAKKLAFAKAFAFVRRPLAIDSITSTSLQNAAIGFVPIIPGADMPIMTLNQVKMVLQISTAYGLPIDKDRIKEIVAVVAGAFLFRNVARSIAKLIPFAGWAVSGLVGFFATEAMGRAIVEYFEAGGDLVGIAKVVQTSRDEAASAVAKASKSKLGKAAMSKIKDSSSWVMRKVSGK